MPVSGVGRVLPLDVTKPGTADLDVRNATFDGALWMTDMDSEEVLRRSVAE